MITTLYNKYRQIFWYLVFGVLTTVVNIIVFWGMHELQTPYQVSYVVAWIAAVLFAYITNRIWVFASQTRQIKAIVKEITQFFMARLITGLIGFGILAFGVSMLHQSDLIWNVIQNGFVIISNYILSKVMIFKAPNN